MRRHQILVIIVSLVIPVGVAGLWPGASGLATEVPAAQDNAQAERQAVIDNLVAKVEAHLNSDPTDGRGWEVLAPVYMQLARYPDAVNAWRKTLQLLGENADRQTNLGQALMAEANGKVTAEAQEAFNRAVALDGTTISARYYLGIAAEQSGRREDAVKIWKDLIASAPPGAHWAADVRAALARVESTAQTTAPDKPATTEQSAMIQGMVDRLAARLKENGSDPDGWARLVHSYKVLGDESKAQAAISDAQRALAIDPDKRKRFDTALKESEDGTIPASPPHQTNGGAAPPLHEGDSIPNMVERLAERLKRSGSDPDGWIMLARSYVTLGDKQKAAAAIKDARAALAADATRLQFFNEALQRFKIDGSGDSEDAHKK